MSSLWFHISAKRGVVFNRRSPKLANIFSFSLEICASGGKVGGSGS